MLDETEAGKELQKSMVRLKEARQEIKTLREEKERMEEKV